MDKITFYYYIDLEYLLYDDIRYITEEILFVNSPSAWICLRHKVCYKASMKALRTSHKLLLGFSLSLGVVLKNTNLIKVNTCHKVCIDDRPSTKRN